MADQPDLLPEGGEAPATEPKARRPRPAPPPVLDACGACRFSQLGGGWLRRCRRFPPVETLPGTRNGVWPVVADNDWCGEFDRSQG
jgi:hypothetical protein